MKCMERFRLPCRLCNSGKDAMAKKPDARFRFDLQRFADGDKTEEPTAKKRQEAAKKGQVGKSQELSTAFVLLIGFFVIKALWEQIYANIAGYTIYIFGHLNQNVDVENVIQLFIGMGVILVKTAMPIMLAVMVVGLAVLCHDFGKPLTTKLDASGALRSFGHAEAGAPLAVNFLERMKAPKKLQETVSKLVEFHMATQNFPDGVSDRAVRRLAAKLAPANIVLWATLCKADALGCGKVVRKLNRNEEIRFRSEPWLEAARRLAVVNSAPQPLVQGRELIALGYRPSPFFGAILKEAFEAQLEGEFLSREGGVEWLKARLQESSEKNMRAS